MIDAARRRASGAAWRVVLGGAALVALSTAATVARAQSAAAAPGDAPPADDLPPEATASSASTTASSVSAASAVTVAPPAPPPPGPNLPPGQSAGGVPFELPRLVFDDGRKHFSPRVKADPPFATWEAHGEFQLRGERDSTLPLTPPASDPGLGNLDRKAFVTTWVRVDSQLSAGERTRFVVQLDLVPRWVFGDLTQGVSAAGDWADDTVAPAFARLRYAYLEYRTAIGLLRVGQQGSHWGLGIVANDGDHRRLFGDYRLGSIVERVAFATRPGGERSPFVVALAGDAVVQDDNAKWSDGDRAYQAVLAAYYERDETFLGVYGVRRWQKVVQGTSDPKADLQVWVLDATARTATPVGETGNVFAYAAAEVATIFGRTSAIRPTAELDDAKLRSFGGAGNVGVVRRAYDRDGRSFGRFAVQLDGGWASGDADPYDDTIRRFTFDPNHTVGLVLFPFAMHFMTARAATNAGDPSLVARGLPGSRFLPSHGGVFGAQYLNPTIVFRPSADLDLKAGVVVAVATSDFVDPYLTTTIGSARNYRGGDARARDLGVELDYGVEWRVALPPLTTLQLGFQAGVLFPGHAFDDASGKKMPTQAVEQLRVGMQF